VPEGFNRRLIALVCAAAGLLPGAWAQERGVSFPANPRYTVQRLEEQYGLGVVTATAMGQDAQGFLWIGTQTGLYRYDGARAKKMTEVESVTGHYILDLLIAPDGTPWFAGSRELRTTKMESSRNWRFRNRPCRWNRKPDLRGGQRGNGVCGAVQAGYFAHRSEKNRQKQ